MEVRTHPRSALHGSPPTSIISQRIHNVHLNDPFVFRSARSRPVLEHMVGEIKKPLYVLLEATCCLLLIACLNVANLLVARAAARGKDLAILTESAKRRGRCNTTRWMPAENVGTLVIRSSHDLEQVALPVQRIVWEMDRDLPVFDVLTMN